MAEPIANSSMPSSRKLPTPELGSLRDIILKHPRERLFVKPTLWRAIHLDLLECTILPMNCDSCPCFAIRPPKTVALLSHRNYRQAEEIHKSLLAAIDTGSTDLKIAELVKFLSKKLVELSISYPLYWPAFNEKSNKAVCFNYYEQSRMKIRCTVIPELRQCQQQHFAFLSHGDRPYTPRKVHHRRVTRKADLDYVKHIKNLPVDPYYVAILIGQAQELCYNGDRAEYIKVNLLTPSWNLDTLILYSSYIPRNYLKKFTDPTKFYNGKMLIARLEIPLLDLDKIIAIFSHMLGECPDNTSLLEQTIEANKHTGSNDGKTPSSHPAIIVEKLLIDDGCTGDEDPKHSVAPKRD